LLASGDSHNQIKLFNINANFTLNKTLSDHTKPIVDLVLIDESTLASAGQDNNIILWDLIGLVKKTTLVGHLNRVNHLNLVSMNNLLVSDSLDCTLRIWDVKKQTLLKNISDCPSAIASTLSNQHYVFSGSTGVNNGLKKWDVLTGQQLLNVNVQSRVGALLLVENNSACK
jgi:WD40 repeat protein